MNRTLIRIERFISALLLFSLVALVVTQVLSRYLFNSPFTWTEELARYSMIWLTFIAAGQVTSQDGHIAITVIDRAVPASMLKWMVVLSRLIVFGICLTLVPGGWRFVNAMMRVSSPAADLPLGFVYLASLLGLALIGLHSLLSAVLIALGRIPATAPPELMETGGIEEVRA